MTTARIIKKYPNRRLYDSEESRYITIADIRKLVLDHTNFVVIDKKTGCDITRSIFLQVISDQEQDNAAILSAGFLAQVIRSYGKAIPANIASHLERSLQEFMFQSQNLLGDETSIPIDDPTKNTLTSGP